MGNDNNVYNLRKNNILYHILSTDDINKAITSKCAVVVYLYYMDTCLDYIDYINNIDSFIDVYIISSNNDVLKIIKKATTRKNVYIFKENRGRDITAFLVSAKEVFYEYEYVCYVHDKAKKLDVMNEDTKFWIYNMWENMISSAGYIRRVIELFEDNEKLGLLLPPEPIGKYMNGWYFNKWSSNYDNTIALCKKLSIKAEIDENIPPISLGTVFWCKTRALQKIFKYDWSYEDFKEEPLPIDGELNHAIERILPYCAQDEGFETHMVMTTGYAEKLVCKAQDYMQMSFRVLNDKLGIRYVYELKEYDILKKKLQNFCDKYNNIYVYGTGERSKDLLKMLRDINKDVTGYIVSDKTINNNQGKLVLSLEEFISKSMTDYGIIIATNQINGQEIENRLRKIGITEYTQLYLTEDDYKLYSYI